MTLRPRTPVRTAALVAMWWVSTVSCTQTHVHSSDAAPADDANLQWWVEHSMLRSSERLTRSLAGKAALWGHPFALSQPEAAVQLSSVWFTAYPASVVTAQDESVLTALGSDELWKVFEELGITGMHLGPAKRAGGLTGRTYTPSVDGHFDRIQSEVDPLFGTEAEYHQMVETVRRHGGIVIGDLVPGHSGKGADFRLAERAYGDYPGLYHMVEIPKADWGLLPPVQAGQDSVNLSPATVERLTAKGYIVGPLWRTLFYEPGVKETDWSATDSVKGADGNIRRWVYLHYFKAGQPTFNWSDPTFGAPRLIVGDAIHSLNTLGDRMLRLDANAFLGIERRPNGEVWSEGNPMGVTANRMLASMVRKLGGYTFQELGLPIANIQASLEGGPDLSYDFITRLAYAHALVTGDTEFLRLMMKRQRAQGIPPSRLIHALQNHDGLSLDLEEFGPTNREERLAFRGKQIRGDDLRQLIRKEMTAGLMGPRAPYNLGGFGGISCTSASLAAAALGISDVSKLTPDERQRIQRAHLLLAQFNAWQPGVFALSGWDLVGTLMLPPESVREKLADGDTRWLLRGAYDVLGAHPSEMRSYAGQPRAEALYGPLPKQLENPHSFARELQRLLALRRAYGISASKQLDIPEVRAKGLLLMIHQLPRGKGVQVTALNFGLQPVDESVRIEAASTARRLLDLSTQREDGRVQAGGRLRIRLAPHQGKALLLQ